jgi:hypothetical protein
MKIREQESDKQDRKREEGGAGLQACGKGCKKKRL